MKRIGLTVFLVIGYLFFVFYHHAFAVSPAKSRAPGLGSFTPSDVVWPSPTDPDVTPTVAQPDPQALCATEDNPFGYYCREGKLYANVGENCRGDRALGTSCTPESISACPDGADTYCVKGSLCSSCNKTCVLPFSLPNGSTCCADTVCQSSYCDKQSHTCQDETATPTPQEQDQPPFSPFSSALSYVGLVILGIGAFIVLKKIFYK